MPIFYILQIFCSFTKTLLLLPNFITEKAKLSWLNEFYSYLWQIYKTFEPSYASIFQKVWGELCTSLSDQVRRYIQNQTTFKYSAVEFIVNLFKCFVKIKERAASQLFIVLFNNRRCLKWRLSSRQLRFA